MNIPLTRERVVIMLEWDTKKLVTIQKHELSVNFKSLKTISQTKEREAGFYGGRHIKYNGLNPIKNT